MTPGPAPVLSNGVEFVHLGLTPDGTYRAGSLAAADVYIVSAEHTAAGWMSSRAPGNNTPVAAYLQQDPGGFGRTQSVALCLRHRSSNT